MPGLSHLKPFPLTPPLPPPFPPLEVYTKLYGTPEVDPEVDPTSPPIPEPTTCDTPVVTRSTTTKLNSVSTMPSSTTPQLPTLKPTTTTNSFIPEPVTIPLPPPTRITTPTQKTSHPSVSTSSQSNPTEKLTQPTSLLVTNESNTTTAKQTTTPLKTSTTTVTTTPTKHKSVPHTTKLTTSTIPPTSHPSTTPVFVPPLTFYPPTDPVVPQNTATQPSTSTTPVTPGSQVTCTDVSSGQSDNNCAAKGDNWVGWNIYIPFWNPICFCFSINHQFFPLFIVHLLITSNQTFHCSYIQAKVCDLCTPSAKGFMTLWATAMHIAATGSTASVTVICSYPAHSCCHLLVIIFLMLCGFN